MPKGTKGKGKQDDSESSEAKSSSVDGDDDDFGSDDSDNSLRNSARGITSRAIERKFDKQRKAERNLIKVVKAYRHLPTMRMSMGQRRFLFFWHLAVILASVGLVGIGIFLSYYFDDYLAERVKVYGRVRAYKRFVRLDERPKVSNFYGPIITDHGTALMGLGMTYLFVTFFYISFLGHRFQFTWPILVLINIIILVLELSNLLVRLSPVAQLSSSQRSYLIEQIKKYKISSKDPFSVAYDYLALWGKCCGITSMYDFQNVVFSYEEIVDGERVTHTFESPAVCCKQDVFEAGHEAVRACAKNMQDTYEPGCFSLIYDLIESYQVVYVLCIGFYIMDLVIHISIYRDMLVSLEPELGIDVLNVLEKARKLDNVKSGFRGNEMDHYLVSKQQRTND